MRSTRAVAVAAERARTTRRARRATSARRPSTENEGGSRAHVCVAGRRACAHVSCLAEQAKILLARRENNLDEVKWIGGNV